MPGVLLRALSLSSRVQIAGNAVDPISGHRRRRRRRYCVQPRRKVPGGRFLIAPDAVFPREEKVTRNKKEKKREERRRRRGRGKEREGERQRERDSVTSDVNETNRIHRATKGGWRDSGGTGRRGRKESIPGGTDFNQDMAWQQLAADQASQAYRFSKCSRPTDGRTDG